MRLYYMTSLETLEQHILPELRIRLSTFDTVNDPFELLCMRQGTKNGRKVMADLYKHWASTLGFVSFSDNWKSPLMWAHYANSHTGVCLGIEIPEGRAMKVVYEAKRLQNEIELSPLEAAIDPKLIQKVVGTKFKEWEYECEWRYLARRENLDPLTGFSYVEFSPDFELREIIAGARCTRSLHKLRKQVFGNTDVVRLIKARAAFETFSMVTQKLVQELTASPQHFVREGK